MKIFTPQLSDTKTLITSIKTAAQQSNAGKWLYIRDIETGDKRANFGLLLHGKYRQTDRGIHIPTYKQIHQTDRQNDGQ